MRDTINKGLLIFAIQQQLFCTVCQKVLDVDDAVSFDALNPAGKTVASKVTCSSCYDRAKGSLLTAVATRGLTLEVIDGRTLRAVKAAK